MTISVNVNVRGAGYWKLRTQSVRVVPAATSVTETTVESPARRISPPAMADCSGSHCRTVAL